MRNLISHYTHFYSYTKLFASGLLIFVFLSSVKSQNNSSINGYIKDQEGKSLNAVNIRLSEENRGAVSDQNGYYEINDLKDDKYKVVYSRVGYKTITKTINLEAGENRQLNVSLKQSEYDLEEVVISGAPTPITPLKSTSDVELLAGKVKTEHQHASMGNTVDQMAGVNTINTGNSTGKPVIRGLSGNRIRMLHNGIAMDYQQYGVRHMPNMDPFLAERIEVVQGPSSVLYGSDAMGGAVNFMIGNAPEARNQRSFLKGEALGNFHTNNSQWTSGLSLEGASEGWGFNGSIIRRSSGNIHTPKVPTFDEPSGKTGDPKFSGELDHTDFDQLNGTFTGGYSGDFGNVSLNYTRWQNAHNFLLPNGKGLGQRLTNNVLQGKSNIRLGNNNTLNSKITYVSNLRQSNKKGDPRSELPATDEKAHLNILREIYSGRVEWQHQNLGPLDGRIGFELRQTNQNSSGQEPLVPSADIFNIGGFVYENLELNRLTLSAGLRYDYQIQEAQSNEQLNLPDSGETENILEQSYNNISGSFGANYQLTDHLALAANIGRGFRAPSIFDLHVDGVHGGVAAYQIGDPELKAESNFNTDFSIKWHSSEVKAKASVYRNAISNYIFLVNTGEKSKAGPPILKTIQGDALLTGGHASVNAQLLSWLNIKGFFETVQGANVDDELEEVDELPLLPATKTGGEVRYTQKTLGPLNAFYVSLGVRHAFDKQAAGRYEPFWQFDQAFPFGRASTDAYTLLDAGIGFDIPFQKDAINFIIQGKNLTNEAYRDFLDTYKGYALNPGRNIIFKLKIPFSIIN